MVKVWGWSSFGVRDCGLEFWGYGRRVRVMGFELWV